MGLVYSAYDPELDRRVALKLLRAHRRRTAAEPRLLREAQALARLNHPNVVAVHDVGVHEGQVFVAMELVAGQTLREWVRARDAGRSWSEIVGVFEAAARGLEAAHREGMVHRDFKPENVMIGDDGRTRVMDFGLARSAGASDSRPSASDSSHGSPPERADPGLTKAGALLGTPAYMAPGTVRGRGRDPSQ